MTRRADSFIKHDPGVWTTDEPEAYQPDETSRDLALRWAVRLRYGLIAGEVALVAGLYIGLGLDLPFALIAAVVVLQIFSNWLLGPRMSKIGENAEHIVGGLFTFDALCLTLILALTGGPENPFSLLYLVQITFSAIVLRRIWTWTLGIVSTIAFGLLFLVSRPVPAFQSHSHSGEFSLHLFGMWLAFTLAALLISFFVGKLSAESRRKEREILLMQKRLARNERLASLVTLSAGAAHEIATPLSTIAVTAKELERVAMESHDTRIAEDARLVRSQVERCRLILERMGAQGADPLGESPSKTGAADILLAVRGRFPSEAERLLIDVDANCLPFFIPARAAVEALAALVKNAMDASSHEQPIILRAMTDQNRVRFMIRDNGSGMSAEVMERVSEPFFTTKSPGKGMGLGAFLAHLFAQRMGGQLSFDSRPGQGCTAILELPHIRDARS